MKMIGISLAVGELLLQLQAVEPREAHIEHETAGHDRAGWARKSCADANSAAANPRA